MQNVCFIRRVFALETLLTFQMFTFSDSANAFCRYTYFRPDGLRMAKNLKTPWEYFPSNMMVREKTWENSYMLPLGLIWNLVWAYLEYPVGPIFTGTKLIGDQFVPSGAISTLVNTTDGTVRQKKWLKISCYSIVYISRFILYCALKCWYSYFIMMIVSTMNCLSSGKIPVGKQRTRRSQVNRLLKKNKINHLNI